MANDPNYRNNFTGGWRIEAGAIEANATGALGTGNGYVAAGTVQARAANVVGPSSTITVDQGGAFNAYAAQTGATFLISGTKSLSQ